MTKTNLSKDLIAWLIEAGVDEIHQDTPQNYYTLIEETLTLPKCAPAASLLAAKPVLRTTREIEESAQISAKESKTLEELQSALAAYEGCALKKTATNMVFGDGNPKAKIMLVGEAPGADEDRLGKPFVGLSGQLLDKMFSFIGLSRAANLYISNVIPWRPPGNRQPTPQETAQCLPFIQRHIELVKPDLLIMVGATAAKALSGSNEGIMRLRGKFRPYESPGLTSPIQSTAIFHPAYLLRSPGQKRETWADLLNIKRALNA
ncbi:Uracil DNA glycosylase superfamily protein [Candidatus Bealeia paramacronuclearis]|uniref:Type-4 uracil-DNA glycosylase n=1 Tax=Candidatus Bealeia paramacronuclearis TaxID=1921001 RepID=A0ABZ2C2H2_9PROT|nr:Uracil DNA glycosylase superfamily protein [Candidatus Bealeia paramacronuclearis]